MQSCRPLRVVPFAYLLDVVDLASTQPPAGLLRCCPTPEPIRLMKSRTSAFVELQPLVPACADDRSTSRRGCSNVYSRRATRVRRQTSQRTGTRCCAGPVWNRPPDLPPMGGIGFAGRRRSLGTCGDQESKSKRTLAPLQSQTRSNGFPAFDLKPLSTGLRPCFRSAWAVRAVIRLPAMVFQIANLHPRCQPLQP